MPMQWIALNRWNHRTADDRYRVVHSVVAGADGRIIDHYRAGAGISGERGLDLGSFATAGEAKAACERHAADSAGAGASRPRATPSAYPWPTDADHADD